MLTENLHLEKKKNLPCSPKKKIQFATSLPLTKRKITIPFPFPLRSTLTTYKVPSSIFSRAGKYYTPWASASGMITGLGDVVRLSCAAKPIWSIIRAYNSKASSSPVRCVFWTKWSHTEINHKYNLSLSKWANKNLMISSVTILCLGSLNVLHQYYECFKEWRKQHG